MSELEPEEVCPDYRPDEPVDEQMRCGVDGTVCPVKGDEAACTAALLKAEWKYLPAYNN